MVSSPLAERVWRLTYGFLEQPSSRIHHERLRYYCKYAPGKSTPRD
jgi:hypothetical protein